MGGTPSPPHSDHLPTSYSVSVLAQESLNFHVVRRDRFAITPCSQCSAISAMKRRTAIEARSCHWCNQPILEYIMSDIILSLIVAVLVAVFLTLTWNQDMPMWCSYLNVGVGGNAIIQPFCHVE